MLINKIRIENATSSYFRVQMMENPNWLLLQIVFIDEKGRV